jgi:hypothetical protein
MPTVQTNNLLTTQYRQAPLPQNIPYHDRIYNAAEKGWSYVGSAMRTSRHILTAGLRSCLFGGQDKKVQGMITRYKIFSAFNIPFNAVSISSQAEKIRQSFERNDYEGIYLGLLACFILVGDILDSLATSVNAALETFASMTSQFISSVGLPLGFILVGLGSISRAVRLYHLNQFSSALAKERFMNPRARMTPQEIRSSVSRYLKNLKTDDPQKLIALERHTTSSAANLLKNLYIAVEKKGPLDAKETAKVVETLHRIYSHLREEMAIQTTHAVSSLFIFTALCLIFLSIGTALPFVLFGVVGLTKLMLQSYQDFRQERLH